MFKEAVPCTGLYPIRSRKQFYDRVSQNILSMTMIHQSEASPVIIEETAIAHINQGMVILVKLWVG